WHDVIADGATALPSAWLRTPVLDPFEVDARAAAMHGVLGAGPLTVAIPGLDAKRPLSASSMQDLLACPQRFLLRHVLSLWARPEPVDTHRISAATYGRLVHRVLEAFLRAHGPAFGARERDLAHWQDIAEQVAD